MKVCKNCGYEHDQRRCKICHARGNKEWALRNPEKVRAMKQAHAAKNKDRIYLERKEYREKNAEAIRIRKAEYAAANSAKIVAKVAAWRAANPNRKREQSHNYRARKRAGGRISMGLADRLYALQKGKCACCGKKLGKDYQMDHIMPLALGGDNADSNMQLLTTTCNLQKNAKHPVTFMQQRGFLL